MKLGRKQVLWTIVTGAAFLTSIVLAACGVLDGAQWCSFNSVFLPAQTAMLLGGAALAGRQSAVKAAPPRDPPTEPVGEP